ncbi:uncharacterized protein LOC125729875 isoform X4 [Brienomyrus brachyistius]|uniref:uncharacterized protein LOC125729875 isoform X4 n=1 Tax=Brienomyrus brachyistius TaxID=42636 RepID=UPI0020B45181|nr:uncharacterized protein LOC125729875 isoform X4 [Brienomyrus brachyistius]
MFLLNNGIIFVFYEYNLSDNCNLHCYRMNSIRRKRCHPLQDVKLHIRLKSDKAVIEERYINVYKGRGVFSTVDICKGDFVVEYRGELLSEKESFKRKNGYSEAKSVFLYDFQWKGKNWCIDASQEDKSLGRLVNDEHRNPNCRMKVVDVEGSPHLCLFAVRDILSGEEINYNYGDSDWPWRRQVAVSSPPKEKSVQNDSQIPQLESGYIEAMDDSHAKKNKSLMDKQMTQASDSFGEVMTAERKRKTSVVAVSSPPKEKSVQNDSQIPQLESGYIEAMDDSHAKKNKSLMDKQMTQASDSFGEVMTAERKRKTSVVAVSSPPKEKSVQNDSQIPQLESGYIEAMDDSHAKKNKSLMDKQMTQASDSFGEVMTAERKRKTSVVAVSSPPKEKSVQNDSQIPQLESGYIEAMDDSHAKKNKSLMDKQMTQASDSFGEVMTAERKRKTSVARLQKLKRHHNKCLEHYVMEDNERRRLEKERTLLLCKVSQINEKLESGSGLPSASDEFGHLSADQVEETVMNTYSSSDVSEYTDYSDVDYVPDSDGSSSDESNQSISLSPDVKKTQTSQRFPELSRRKQQIHNEPTKTRKSSQLLTQDFPHSEESVFACNSISVPSSQSVQGKYTKKQYCLFCGKPYSKIARHLESAHSDEKEVAKALQFSKNSRERHIQLSILRKRGNFTHNVDTVRGGSGNMVACYRPTKTRKAKDYIHCLHCQGLYSKGTLWKHIKICPQNPDPSEGGKKYVRSLCAMSTPVGLDVSQSFKDVLCNMAYNEISAIVRSDRCILQLGQHFFNKIGSDKGKHDYIRQKLREIGRLLQEARKCTPLHNMEDFVIPSNFPHVVKAVKVVAGYNEETHSYQIPSLAMKLGHSLKKIASIVESNATIVGDNDLAKSVRRYLQVHQAKWSECISSCALTTLREAKWNTPQLLPFTQDVKLLHSHLEKKQEEMLRLLKICPSRDSYTGLTKVTLTQVILFNRRREGEVSKMHMSIFASRNKKELHDDLAICMSDFERKLCQHFMRLEIRGKRGRKVPVLLKPSMVHSMELLMEFREQCGVPTENPFLFARPGALSAYRGRDCIQQFAKECGAKQPEALSSTKLRKHIATMSKVLNLEENEADQLADFLGHDIRVHREYYRLPEGTLQLAKMSKVLMAMEEGTLSDFKGKKLDEIEINLDEKIDPRTIDDSSSSEEEEPDKQNDGLSEDYRSCDVQNLSVDSTQSHSEGVDVGRGGGKASSKRTWNVEEVKAVERHMMNFIRICRVPGKKECLQCLNAEPEVLKSRTWTGVKFYIKNRITALKRKGMM